MCRGGLRKPFVCCSMPRHLGLCRYLARYKSRDKNMVSEVTRYIKRDVERELWARSAARCQFDGCNKLLYKSSVTQETVNLAQKAHIYSFSKNGPRGWGPFSINMKGLNEVCNLMLMCHGCHRKIDQDNDGDRYSADLLIEWKRQHEQKIEIVTGIRSDKKTHVILYGANIGLEKSPIEYVSCIEAMFPNWYPAGEMPIQLSMVSELRDSSPDFWQAESSNLYRSFERKISPIIEQDDCMHFSVFALAPQPLLIMLGSLLTDKISVETYQPRREPKGWMWQDLSGEPEFILNKPSSFDGVPALVLSLSDHVASDRITRILGDDASIWELTIESPNNDFMQSKSQLSLLRKNLRQLMVDIKQQHGNDTTLHIFPVMPVSCAIELGRIRMPKADMPWKVYDQDKALQEFKECLEL